MQKLNLNESKLPWHWDRVEAWLRGERIAPVTVDMALTQRCNLRCAYCYAQLQQNPSPELSSDQLRRLLDDFAAIGVKGVSLVSDGESTCHPAWREIIRHGADLGLSIALGTNGTKSIVGPGGTHLMDALTYLRFNISAFSPDVWATVHGANADLWEKVIVTIADSVHINAWLLPESRCTIGLQMILIPATLSQVIPLTRWARAVGVDYMQIKHCSDDERGSLGIDYGFYKERYTREVLTEAEKLSTKDFQVIVKWEKLLAGNERAYRQCFGPPFHLQISGSGVVAPCGMFFHPAYKKYWIGNLNKQTFKEIWESDRYWEVMKLLSSKSFNAQKACGCLCLQDATNQYLDRLKKGQAPAGQPTGDPPAHVNFI